jgi:hypothetical protein
MCCSFPVFFISAVFNFCQILTRSIARRCLVEATTKRSVAGLRNRGRGCTDPIHGDGGTAAGSAVETEAFAADCLRTLLMDDEFGGCGDVIRFRQR